MSLLVLFEQDDLINLSKRFVLNVNDQETNKSVPVSGIEAGGNYLQGVVIQHPALQFYEVESGREVVIDGYSYVLLCGIFNNSGDTADVQLILEDTNGIQFLSDKKTLTASDVTGADGSYISNYVTISTFNSYKARVLISGSATKVFISVA